MPLDLYNDVLDDTPAMAESAGFIAADFATKGDGVPPDTIIAGENVYADESGHLATRPGLRWVTACDNGAITTSAAVQGMAYYDTPEVESLVVARDGVLYDVRSDAPGATFNVLTGVTPTLSTSARVTFAQLVDRIFYVDGAAALRWSRHASGTWTHGSVANFSNVDGTTAGAMPAWGGVVAHQLRLFAWPADGSRLYASAIGTAHNVVDWRTVDNLRFGIGEGDPIVAAKSAQAGSLIVLTRSAVYAVDTRDAALANWTIVKITDLTGCAAARSAVTVGQDVLFLARYGVVNLGALADNISINPAATISAPMQPIIDRINWNAKDAIHATVWRDFYLLALPLDDDTMATIWLPFNLRTRRWAAPWRSALGGLVLGTYAGSLFRDEAGSLLVSEAPEILGDAGASPSVTIVDDAGWSAAAVTLFDGRQETILADKAGRLLRIDPPTEKDDTSGDFSQDVSSWATLKAHDFGLPQHPKQPFSLEVVFFQSTAAGVQILYVPDNDLTFPRVELAEAQRIETNATTGTFGVFPILFPLRFRPNLQTRKTYHLRRFRRFRSASLQIYAARGRLRLRSMRMSAFVDSPQL
jgi:hypothetical protein